MRVAGVRLGVEGGEGAVGDNVESAVERVRAAAAEGTALVVLPELFGVGYFAFDSYARVAGPAPIPGPLPE